MDGQSLHRSQGVAERTEVMLAARGLGQVMGTDRELLGPLVEMCLASPHGRRPFPS